MKQTIRLTECELKRIIAETVESVFNEGKYGYTKDEIMSGKLPGFRYIKSPYGLMAIQPFDKYGSWLYVEGRTSSIPLPLSYKDADDKAIVDYALKYIKREDMYTRLAKEDEDDDDEAYLFGWD